MVVVMDQMGSGIFLLGRMIQLVREESLVVEHHTHIYLIVGKKRTRIPIRIRKVKTCIFLLLIFYTYS